MADVGVGTGMLYGMAECMAAAGLNEDKAEEVLNFIKQLVRPFAEKAGAAVLISDHVTKSWEDRGLWSRGSGAKMGRYDGVSYALTLVDAYAPGQAGSVLLTVAKDRNGGVGVKGRPVAQIYFMPAADNRTLVSFRVPDDQSSALKPLKSNPGFGDDLWAQARAYWEECRCIRKTAEHFGLSQNSVKTRARREEWRK